MATFLEADSCVSGRIRPTADNLLVKPIAPPEEKNALIILPDRDLKKTEVLWAEVVAVGDGSSWGKMCRECRRPFDRYNDDVRVGDLVALDNPHSGDVVIIGGVEHRLVRMAEVHLCDERAPREAVAAE